jgi:hypothetical protein
VVGRGKEEDIYRQIVNTIMPYLVVGQEETVVIKPVVMEGVM